MKMLSVVMPALNEEEGIVQTIESIPVKELKKLGYSVEIVVVDGGSKDKTVALAKKAGARVIESPRGYGRQYKEGLKKAKGEIIVTGDSDGTYPFEHIPQYLSVFERDNLDFATVNRFAQMKEGSMKTSNKIGNWGLTIFTNLLFGFSIKDSQSGMWIIRSEKLKQLRVVSDGMPFSQEIKIEAFRRIKSKEISGTYKRRLGETKLAKFKDGFGNLGQLFKMRLFYDRSLPTLR